MKASEIPDKMLKLIDKAQRLELGLLTQDEIAAQAEIKSERDLHRQIENLLRLKDIVFFSSRMDRRTTTQVGMPDFIFATICSSTVKATLDFATFALPCAWELKVAGRPLEPEQVKMFERMRKNGWACRVIRSVDDALAELKRLGL